MHEIATCARGADEMTINELRTLPLGTVLIAAFPFFQHVGIITGRDHRGLPVVTCNSARKRGVCEETFEEFSGGHPLTAESRTSQLPRAVIVQRARSAIGQRYSLVHFNCDHFVEWTMGREPSSRQLQTWATVASLIGFVVILKVASR
jgi:hypothetical protein